MSNAKACTLYLDSTGDGGWNRPYGNSRTRYYVIAGLSVSPESNLKAYREVERILRKYFSGKVILDDVELCYHDLIYGKGSYSKLADLERLHMANEVFDLILDLKPNLFSTVIDKPMLKQRYGSNAYDPKLLALRATIHRFAMSLTREGVIGTVTMDAEEYRKDRKIQEMVRTFKRGGIILRGMTYQPRYDDRISQVIDIINFTESAVSAGIQLADFCARSTWQHYENNKSNRFNQLSPIWNHVENKVYEPSLFPK